MKGKRIREGEVNHEIIGLPQPSRQSNARFHRMAIGGGNRFGGEIK